MVKLEDLYAFIEKNFDFLLVVDMNEKIIHANQSLVRECAPEEIQLEGKLLKDVLTDSSLNTFASAMGNAREGSRGIAVYSPIAKISCSLPLKASYSDTLRGGVYLFFGLHRDDFSNVSDWKRKQRIRELTCLYSVAEWIERADTVREFFIQLPDYINSGMCYPDAAVCYSVYQGMTYGQKPSSCLSVELTVSRQVCGEILVGYMNDDYEFLPEEQKMLNEIGRMIGLALEKKALSQRLKDLEEEIEVRTKDLDEQNRKLNIVDSNLVMVNKGWEESKTYLEAIFQTIPDDVALIDRNRRLMMTNRQEAEPGTKCHRAFFDRDVPCQDCRLKRIIADKAPLTLTIKHNDKYLQVYAMPIYNQNHEVDAIIEFFRDVTLEMTYEQQIQQADKMASLGQLVSGVGHEINNPNQFIQGNIRILKQALDDMLPIVEEYHKDHPDLTIARLKYDFFREHIMTLVDDMARGSERIKGIVKALRSFTQRNEGLLVDTIEVNTIIEASVRLVHDEVHKRADIDLDLAENLHTFAGNSQKIEQVLINLILNAGQAMPDDRRGRITIRTSKVRPDAILIEIQDNGRGMSEQTAKQIFDPFFTTKRNMGGTGLGLPIAFKIIEEHRGSISVDSRLGVGTTFSIRIPAPSGS
ncbi:MAG: hypothetical protein KOO61_08520 [Spirochaetales bacterium]|nr:hypothetical protein [Spirochaetales bacterium]